jgi:hypothetical protein
MRACLTAHIDRYHKSARLYLIVTRLLIYLLLVQVERLNVRNGQTLLGYLYMVDLAGSERVQLSNMSGKRLREAQTINK